jgi:hypothetical protein
VLDFIRRDAGTIERSLDGNRAKLDGGFAGECSVDLCNRGARPAENVALRLCRTSVSLAGHRQQLFHLEALSGRLGMTEGLVLAIA